MRALLPTLCCLAAFPALAVIVDRIAITVGNKVITDSEIDLRIRLTAFENGEKPNFSLTARKVAADRLIDQKLVEHEMDVGHYPRLKAETTAPDTAARDRALAQYGLTPTDLEQDLARQADLLNFLNLRFRPSVQVSDQDIAGKRADAEMETWLRDQRKGVKIVYLEKDLAP